MEYALGGDWEWKKEETLPCLNPYSNGICARSWLRECSTSTLLMGLNPYSIGICFVRFPELKESEDERMS